MKTVLQKNNGRFHTLNILMDDLTEVDMLVKLIRAAQDNDNAIFTDNELDSIDTLLKECEEITKVDKIEPF